MKLRIVFGAVAALIVAFIVGRVLLQRDGRSSTSGEAGQEPPASASSLVRGEAAFFKHCVACHSPDTDQYVAGIPLQGYFSNPPSELSDGTVFPRNEEAIRDLIEQGTTDMPPLAQGMTLQEIDDILAYLHTL